VNEISKAVESMERMLRRFGRKPKPKMKTSMPIQIKSAGKPVEVMPNPMEHLGCRDGVHLLIWSDKLKRGDVVCCAYCRTPFEFRSGKRFSVREVK